MSRRIVAVAVVTAATVLLLFAIPLAVAVRLWLVIDEHDELERAALRVALVAGRVLVTGEGAELPGSTGIAVGVYDLTGRRVAGSGPERADVAVRRALGGELSQADDRNELVTALPVSSGPRVVGAARASSPRSTVFGHIVLIWTAMALLAMLSVGGGVVLARRQARRLTRPLEEIAAVSRTLGKGDFSGAAPLTRMPEVDEVVEALNTTVRRVEELVRREREFSQNASHQLRTPLTSLRLRLEALRADPHRDVTAFCAAGLATIDRLELTIADLLLLSRPVGGVSSRPGQPLAALIQDAQTTWKDVLAAAGRSVVVAPADEVDAADDETEPVTSAPPNAVRQILDVLLDNAYRHGAGTVTISARTVHDVVAVDVSDQGSGVPASIGDIFQRGLTGTAGSGLGLGLATELARDHGGRLLLTRARPHPVFTLLLPAARPVAAGCGHDTAQDDTSTAAPLPPHAGA